MGYHLATIRRGELGEPSKIVEETEEFMDAIRQGNPVMAIAELSDLVGAIEAYLEKKHPTITLDHLVKQKDATKRAFKSGRRGPPPPSTPPACQHLMVETGPRMPATYGSYETKFCIGCGSFQFKNAVGWTEWFPPNEIANKFKEDDER